MVTNFIQAMPKAEIHIHLEGAIQPKTVLELARRHKMLDQLPALLRTPDDFALIVYACGEDMAQQNIRYRELTVTPYTHLQLQDKGLTIDDLLDGLEQGRAQAKADFGVEMRWVFDIPRNTSFPKGQVSQYGEKYIPQVADVTLGYAVAGKERGVVGFGLGGYEVGAPPQPFAHAFADAIAEGLLSVPHAGETMGAESVRGAVEALGAKRIGHGVRAMEDPSLLALLKERQIVLEVNPTSNICLHVYRRLAEHPFPHLDRMGLLLTVSRGLPAMRLWPVARQRGLKNRCWLNLMDGW